MISGAFRIGGIYRSKNTSLDELNVYVLQKHLQGLLELQPSESNEIALLIKDDQEVDVIKKESEEMLPDAKIEDGRRFLQN